MIIITSWPQQTYLCKYITGTAISSDCKVGLNLIIDLHHSSSLVCPEEKEMWNPSFKCPINISQKDGHQFFSLLTKFWQTQGPRGPEAQKSITTSFAIFTFFLRYAHMIGLFYVIATYFIKVFYVRQLFSSSLYSWL